MKKKSKNTLIIVGVIVLALAVLLGTLLITGVFSQATVPSGTYVQAPTFYYYECSPSTSPQESTHVNLNTGSSDGWITCPSNTDQCDLWVYQTETPKWFATDRRLVYQICHKSGVCDPQVKTPANSFFSKNGVPTVHISNLIIGDKVWIDYQAQTILGAWNNKPDGASWYQTYKPFILWKVDMFNGGKTEYSSVDKGCTFSSSERSNLIDSVVNSIKQINQQSSTDDYKLDFYKTRNFIGGFVPIATDNVNFVTYNGQAGYCLNRQVFAITTVTTNSNTYQIIDTNFNTRLASSVTCCPNEKEPTRVCNSNFQWVDIEQAECSTFNPCAGADWMPSPTLAKTLVRYNCVSGKCVADTKTVECTTNSDCGSTQTCDTKTYKCVDVSPGDIIPGGNDTLQCTKWYQTEYTKTSCGVNPLCWTGIVKPKVITKCKTVSWLIWTIVGLVIVLVLVLFFWFKLAMAKVRYGK